MTAAQAAARTVDVSTWTRGPTSPPGCPARRSTRRSARSASCSTPPSPTTWSGSRDARPAGAGGLEAVAAFFDNWQRRGRGGGDDPLLGCLVVNSTAELGGHAAFAPTAAGYRAMLLEAFTAALQEGEARGETNPGGSAARARALTALTIGIFVAARGNADDAEVDALFGAARAVVAGWRR